MPPDPCLSDPPCFELSVDGVGALVVTPKFRPPADFARALEHTAIALDVSTGLPSGIADYDNGLFCTSTGLWAPPLALCFTHFYDAALAPFDVSGSSYGRTTVGLPVTAPFLNQNPQMKADVHYFAYVNGRVNIVGGAYMTFYLHSNFGGVEGDPASFIVHNPGTVARDATFILMDFPTALGLVPNSTVTATYQVQFDKTGPVGGYISGVSLRLMAFSTPSA